MSARPFSNKFETDNAKGGVSGAQRGIPENLDSAVFPFSGITLCIPHPASSRLGSQNKLGSDLYEGSVLYILYICQRRMQFSSK